MYVALASCAALAACGDVAGVGSPGTLALTVFMTPPVGVIADCNWVQLGVIVYDFNGDAVTPDSTRWWSSDTTSISVSTTGKATALRAIGADTIRATVWSASRTGSAQQLWSVADPLVLNCPPNAMCAAPPCAAGN
jgi:hypothetical protein